MIAVLDANVLFPQYLCDLMLSLAETELFQPRWSDFIHDEWMRNLFKTFPELEISRIKRRREMMDRAFPDASVSFDSELIESIAGVHAKDRHVMAAAIVSHADAVVTFNRKDFLKHPFTISIVHPDKFVTSLLEQHPDRVIESLNQMRRRYTKPPVSADAFISIFRANRLKKFTNGLHAFIGRL